LKKIKSRHRMRNFEGSPFQINNPNILYIWVSRSITRDNNG
jgi:hypothetical protein